MSNHIDPDFLVILAGIGLRTALMMPYGNENPCTRRASGSKIDTTMPSLQGEESPPGQMFLFAPGVFLLQLVAPCRFFGGFIDNSGTLGQTILCGMQI